MKRRILSIVTALALCLSLCPTWAFAAEPDTGLCAHDMDECRICPIEDALAALPRALTEDNAETVRWQLDEILDLWRELSEDEQEQIDLSPCWDLQAALDEANVPAPIDEPHANALAEVRLSDGTTTYPTTEAEFLAAFFVEGNSGATVTLLKSVNLGSEELAIPDHTEFTLEGGTYEITSSSGATVVLGIQSTFTLLSGTLSNTNARGAAVQLDKDNSSFTMSGGTVNGTSIAVSCSSSSLVSINISGGAVNGGQMGLSAPTGTVKLSGGTYSSIFVDSKTAADILTDGCALQVGDGLISRDKPLSGRQNDVKVVNPCPHTGALEDKGNGTHGATTEDGNCPYCGTKFEAAPHTLGADNECEGCKTPLVASVKIGNATTYYGTIFDTWDAVTAGGVTSAEVTLLADVTETLNLSVDDGDKITLNGGSNTISIQGFMVSGGQLDISSGTFKFAAALMVSGGTVRLSGGEFINTNGQEAISCMPGSNLTVGDFLLNHNTQNTPHYAYFNEAGKPIALTEEQTSLTGTVTVQECGHEGVTPTPNNDGTHTLKCPYCGYTEAAATNCSYGTEYQYDENNHWLACNVCGYENKEAHDWTFIDDSIGNGSVIENYQECNYCEHTKDHLTLTITVPTGLTYGNTGGKQVTYTLSPEKPCEKVTWKFTSGNLLEFADGVLPAGLAVGEHLFHVEGRMEDDTLVFSGNCSLTVSAAPLTGDMVTLSTESVTYSGAAQEPAVTVKQGETPLEKGADYTVGYSNNVNAGEAAVTITGKGNYTGEVKKTFSITRATPNITTNPTASAIEYGQKLSDSTLTGGSAVNPNGNAAVAGKWSWASGGTQPTATGDFATTFIPTDTANYETPASVNVSVTVNPATPKITVAAPSHQKAGKPVTVTAEIKNPHDETKDDLPAVTLTWKVGDGAEQPITDGKFTVPDDAAVDTVITITATSAAVDGKYDIATKTATVTVTDKTPVTITGVSVTGRAYNGKAIDCTGEPVITTLEGENVTDATVSYTWSSGTAPVNAGSYSLEISVNGETYIGSTTVDFTISKASITITADSLTANVGSEKPALTCTVDGLADGDTLDTEPTLTCDADMDTIGSYPITASGAAVPSGGNYNEEITYVPGTLTVIDPTIHVTGVTLNKASTTLPVGGSERLTATAAPSNATNKGVTWTSDNTAVAVVDANGTVTAVSAGTATITVTTADGGKTAVCTVTVRAKDVTILPNPPADVDGTKFQLVMETGISEVPEGLKNVEGLDTPEKLVAVMKTAITAASSGVSQANTAVYDVALMVSTDGGTTWTPATKENFPSGGLTITLPYPAGTDSSYRFTVVHMFTTDDFGKRPGDTEIFTPEQVRKTTDGIQVVVTGLSPISVGWEKAYVPNTPSGGGSNGGGSSKPGIVPVEKPEQDSVTSRFTDLGGPEMWYYDAVEFVLRNGLMNGYNSSLFGPDDNLSRAQLAQILYNKEGKPAVTGSSGFTDVADGQWYAPAITWAAGNGIVSGYGDGRFGPDDNITREQLAVMLWRYAGNPAATDKELHFADAYKASGYALDALLWAAENSILNGYGDGRLNPGGLATRAQVAQILMNFLGK